MAWDWDRPLAPWLRRVLVDAAVALRDQPERWILWAPVMLAGGIAIYFALPVEPPAGSGRMLLAGAGMAALAALLLARRGRTGAMLPVAALALLALGLGLGVTRTAQVAAPLLDTRLGPVELSGRVVRVEHRAGSRRLTLGTPRIQGLGADETPTRVRVTDRVGGPDPAPGARVLTRAVLLPVPPPVVPGAYDPQRAAYFRGIGARGFTVAPVRVLADPGPLSAREWLDRVRAAVGARVEGAMTPPEAGLAVALITGDRDGLEPSVTQAMRDAGLAHLLAISGLHLGLVAMTVFAAIRVAGALIPPVAGRWNLKKPAALAAILAALLYMLLAGASVPTQRAFLMVGIALLAVLVDRQPLSLRLVGVAAATILIHRPESLVGPSFQMSFAAVIALVAVYERLAARWDQGAGMAGDGPRGLRAWPLPVRYLLGVALTSAIAGLATGPIAAYHFNVVPVYGIAANMLAVPVVALLVIPAALAALPLALVGLDGAAFWAMEQGLALVVAVARWFAALPGATVGVPAVPAWALLPAVAGGLWLALWRGRVARLGGLGLAASVVVVALWRPPDILVSGDGRLWAARDVAGGYALTSRSAFARDVVLRRSAATGLACDSLACVLARPGHVVAFVKDPMALPEECRHATVLISRTPVRTRCLAPDAIIDPRHLRRAGAHAIRLRRGGVEIVTDRDRRGRRPWVRPSSEPRR